MKKTILLIFLVLAFLALGRKPVWAAYFSLAGGKEAGLGERFSLTVGLKTEENVNAVELRIEFEPQFLEVVSLDTSSSVFAFFAQKDFDNSQGKITVVAGSPSPGVIGAGRVIRVNFRAKKIGETQIRVGGESKILTNVDNRNLFTQPAVAKLLIKEKGPTPTFLAEEKEASGEGEKITAFLATPSACPVCPKEKCFPLGFFVLGFLAGILVFVGIKKLKS